ncbi:hypothetical protein [Flaviaesturariibacter terrae]
MNVPDDQSPQLPKDEVEHLRPAPLYGVIFCALIIVLVGVVYTIRHELILGNLPSGRGAGAGRPSVFSGPAAIVLGVLFGVYSVYLLWKRQRRRGDGGA